MPSSSDQVVSEVGKRLAQPRLGKDALVKLLKQAESVLSELSQSSSLHDALRPLSKSLVIELSKSLHDSHLPSC